MRGRCRLTRGSAEEAANQKVGRPDIGGPFVLDALDGSRFTEKDLLGRFTMLYVRSLGRQEQS